MSIELGLLADIGDHPDDDAPRLILADWLQEHPDPVRQARGEFVRLQVRRGAGPVDDAQRRRENTLRDTYAPAWLGPLAARVSNQVFQRGLLRLVLTGDALERAPPEELAGLPEWAWVDGLTVRGFRAQDLQVLGRSPALEQLNSLVLHMTALPSAAWAPLFHSRHLHRLRRLKPSFDTLGGEGVSLLAGAESMPGLRELDLVGNALGDAGLEALACSPLLGGLERLRLGNNGVGDEGVRMLVGSPFLHRLRSLYLDGNALGDAGVQALADCPGLAGLAELVLHGNRSGAEGAWALVHSRRLERLERVTYDASGLSQRCQDALRQRFPRFNCP
jgi:uncharacterized protein (TIGR02996 family)